MKKRSKKRSNEFKTGKKLGDIVGMWADYDELVILRYRDNVSDYSIAMLPVRTRFWLGRIGREITN